jgi:hypothetical protein
VKRVLAWCLLAFAVGTWIYAELTFVKTPFERFVIGLSELALIYESINAIWHAKQMDGEDS